MLRRAWMVTSLLAACSTPAAPIDAAASGDATTLDSPLADDASGVDAAATDGASSDAPPPHDAWSPPGAGHVAYTLAGRSYLVEARAGATPRDLSAELDALSAGSDGAVNVSPDGQWLVLGTGNRLGCDYDCLLVAPADLSSAELIRAPSGLVHADGRAAIASGGGVVVLHMTGGTHASDLFVSTRTASGWTAPRELTTASSHPHHLMPAVADDGARVLFDCGPEPYGQAGTGICEVAIDGTGFRDVRRPTDHAGGTSTNAIHHPDYAPDGTIVTEADWMGEQIWRLSGGSEARVEPSAGDDNSPCVLPDGRVASLWLGRAGGGGLHELKLMGADGMGEIMLVMGADVDDIGLGCGR